MNKKSFILYTDQYAPLAALSLEQKGVLLDAVFQFNTGTQPEISDPVVSMAFAFFRQTFERDQKKYNQVCNVRSEAGKKGGRPKRQMLDSEPGAEDEKQKKQLLSEKAKKAESDSESDILREEPVGSLSPAAPPAESPPPCPHEKILELYHEILPELPQARTWGGERQSLLRSRHRETWERLRKKGEPHGPDALLDWWRKYFLRVKNSSFLVGRELDRQGKPFFADLEWLVRPRNYAKVIDGKYLPRRAA